MFFLVAFVCFGVFLLIFMSKEAFANRILYHELFFPNGPQVTIFFISDIHRREISNQIISEVIGKADLVIVGGDLTEKGVPIKRVKTNLMKLNMFAPIYFVWGNNDYENDPHLLEAALVECGVNILTNTAVDFESNGGNSFVLMGVDDTSKGRDRLDLALNDAGNGGFRILVSHNPNIIIQILPENDIQLVLSGHTHGGQIRIFGFGPYEKGGFKKLGKSTVLVSNGYGTTALPLRLGAKSETHLITIKH